MSHSFSKKFVYVNDTEMKHCSVQIIAYIGGSLFLAFAAITIVEIVTWQGAPTSIIAQQISKGVQCLQPEVAGSCYLSLLFSSKHSKISLVDFNDSNCFVV